MDPVRKEKLRIARSSNTPEARVQAFFYLAGDDDAYDIFIEALNNRNVLVVKAAIYALANYHDSRWEILLELLEDDGFGYGKEIIQNIKDADIDLEAYTPRLRNIIPQRYDALDLIQTLTILSSRYGKIADILVRESMKHHDFWSYGNAYIINYLDLKHPVSLNIVKRMLFEEPLDKFNSLVEKTKVAVSNHKSVKSVKSDFIIELFGFLSTLTVLANKYREIDNDFSLQTHLSNLDDDFYSKDVVNTVKKYLQLYVNRELKTDLKHYHFGYAHGGWEEMFWEESMDEYVHLDR